MRLRIYSKVNGVPFTVFANVPSESASMRTMATFDTEADAMMYVLLHGEFEGLWEWRDGNIGSWVRRS